MSTRQKIDAILTSLRGDVTSSATFDPAVSPLTGGYQLVGPVKGDASEWMIYKQIGPYTIYRGTGKKAGKYLVKGVGENSEMNTYSQAFDLVQHLMRY